MPNPIYPTVVVRANCKLEVTWNAAGAPTVIMYAAVAPTNGRDQPLISGSGPLTLTGPQITALNGFIDSFLTSAAGVLGLG